MTDLSVDSDIAKMSLQRLRGMWTEHHFVDLEITCADQSWSVHRSVLATASPVFHRMLISECKEAQLQTIDIKADPEDVRFMLEFVYGVRPKRSKVLPQKLRVSTNRSDRGGIFELQDGKLHGLPFWKRSGGDGDRHMVLVSASDQAKWQVTNAQNPPTGLVGEDLFGVPHHGKMPHLMAPVAPAVGKVVALDLVNVHEELSSLSLSLLELASLYQVTDLVLLLVKDWMMSDASLTKDNIVAIALALRDVEPSPEAESLTTSLHELVSKDRELFLAMLRAL